jgi:hypothetical protein
MHNGLSPKNKLKGLATLSQTGAEIRETSNGTTLLGINGQTNAKPEVTFVQLDIKELDIPYDVIIGRPDIRQHQLLRFDPELCLTGLEKPDKGSQPALINKARL